MMDRAGSAKRSSVRLSVCAIISPPRATAAGLLLWAQRPGDIDRLSHGQCLAGNASGVTLSAYVWSWTETFFVSPFEDITVAPVLSGACSHYWLIVSHPLWVLRLTSWDLEILSQLKGWLTFEIWQFQSKLSLPLLVFFLNFVFLF